MPNFFLFVLTMFLSQNLSTTIPNDLLPPLNIGDKAPAFNLKNIDGKMYSFDNIKDINGNQPEGYIIVFTCNTCPVAKSNEQRLNDLHTNYAEKGYVLVAIQPNDPVRKPGDNFDAMITNAKKKNFEFLYLIDEGQKVYPQYGATKTPEVFLLDKNLIVKYHGAIDDSARDEDNVDEKFLENAIMALEKGIDPSPNKTKAIGCGIKGKRA